MQCEKIISGLKSNKSVQRVLYEEEDTLEDTMTLQFQSTSEFEKKKSYIGPTNGINSHCNIVYKSLNSFFF